MDKDLFEELLRSMRQYNQIMNGDKSKFTSGQLPEAKCIWDTLSEEDKLKPMGISCPCRKCSAWC